MPPKNRHRRLPFGANELGLIIAIFAVLAFTAVVDADHDYVHAPIECGREILLETSFLAIFALGSAIVIITGGIDLSAGSMVAFSASVCASCLLLMTPDVGAYPDIQFGPGRIAVAISITLFAGLLVGTFHAWLITVIRLPPFIATLATLVGLRSFARWIVNGVTAYKLGNQKAQIVIADDTFRSLGDSYVIPPLVCLVLVIACVNVVNLVLARTSDRRRERDVRLALGATRKRLFKESLVQHVALAVFAGLVGATAASWAIPKLVQLAPVDIPRVENVTIDGRVLLACLALSVSVGVVLSLVSALSSVGSDTSLTIRSAQVGGTRTRHRVRRLLIVTEVGLSLVLLIGAGLLLRSFVKLQQVDPGFSTSGVTTVSLSLPRSRYGSPVQQAAFYREIVDRMSERREIQSVGATTNLPLSGSAMSFGFSIDGRPEATLNEQLAAEYHAVTPGYFRTMGIQLRSGRAPSRQDDVANVPVVIVNETFAGRYWPNEDPLGKSITVVSQGGPTSREIVGVVADVRHAGLASLPRVEVYVPLSQDPWAFVTLVLRAPVETPVAPLVRAELAELDVGLPIGAVIPIEGLVSRWLAPLRFQMVLVGMFAVTALLLATLGIYGVISYVVSLRTNEIGVRMALGAHTGHVFGSVVGQGVWLATVGTVLGVVGAFWTTRYLSSQLFEVSTTDPLVFLSAPALVLFVALLGSSLPALRAVKVDPVEALRET